MESLQLSAEHEFESEAWVPRVLSNFIPSG